MKSILILFHCESNTGYAIETLESVFFKMACALVNQDHSRIHIAYTSMTKGRPRALPETFQQYTVFDIANADLAGCEKFQQYLEQRSIDTVLAFDQPVHRAAYRYLRDGGVKCFVSYWGAPISSIFGPIKRTLKRLEVALRRHGPDHYIFESEGMAQTAVLGRGIRAKRVHVAYLGVDTEKFKPDPVDAGYIHDALQIPAARRIFFYSGHMEHRKGVGTIMQAANVLAAGRTEDDWHIVLTGNRPGEETALLAQLSDNARTHVTFGGYRADIPRLHRGCHAGIIASVGWDSLTYSSLEMQSSGLPLLLSDLLGLREAVEHEISGELFPPGNAQALAARMIGLLDDGSLRQRLAGGARKRALALFTKEQQLNRLTALMRQFSS